MMIYLIGFKCSGKTTLGKLLAPAVGFDFLDLDDLMEYKYGKSIPTLYSAYGEQTFRSLERDVFNEIPNNRNIILATGGGFPRWNDNMDILLKTGITVYIQEQNHVIYERMNRISDQRPILNGMKDEPLMDYIIAMKSSYEDIYRKATIIYKVNETSFAKLVDELRIFKMK